MRRKSVGFKTLTITCLALALISTISLNIIRTYSINNTRTNALGNTTSGIATQSASDGNALTSPPSISLKLSPVTTNTTSNPDNGSAIVSLNIPADGGVAVGGHSVEVTTNSTAGYKVTMRLDDGTDLVNTDLPSQTIPSLPEPTSDTLTPLEDKTWGDDYSKFVYLVHRWFLRGGRANNGSSTGLFHPNGSTGSADYYSGLRSVLLTAP